MKVMRVDFYGKDRSQFLLVSKDKQFPAICVVSNLKMDDINSAVLFDIDWLNKGMYTNGMRKKLLARTMRKLITKALKDQIRKLHTKDTNV
jgi:hypothetical protein